MPQIQLPKVPKLKTRKIFTAAGAAADSSATTTITTVKTTKIDCIEIKPKPLVNITPTKISTISSLVDGAPTYDYSFGGANVPQHIIGRIVEDDEEITIPSKSKGTRAEKFSRKITKQYKELSELKFKDIFGKKTVVQTTEIHPNLYTHQNYEQKPNISDSNRFWFRRTDSNDTDTEIQPTYDRYNEGALPPSSSDPPFTKRRQFVKNASEESTSSSSKRYFPKAASLQAISGMLPNDSSLWRLKKSKSKSSSAVENVGDDKGHENNNNSKEKRSRFGKRTLSRQNIDAVLDKAKKSVNSKFRHLKFLQSRTIGSKDSENSTKKSTVKAAPVVIIDRTGSFDSFDSEKVLRDADLAVLREEWLTRKMLSASFDPNEIPQYLLAPQDSIEDIQEVTQVCIVSRPAPAIPLESQASIEELDEPDVNQLSSSSSASQLADISKQTPSPKQSNWISNNQIIVAFYQASASTSPAIGKKNIFPEFTRGHSRKPSMESSDSDSWIPEKIRGMTRNQVELNKIAESSTDAWQIRAKIDDNSPIVIKKQSIDIFQQEGGEAFDDFDRVLRNAPVILVRADSYDYDNRFYDQRSVDFSTTDDDEEEEDDIDPDISTVLELPQDNIISDDAVDEHTNDHEAMSDAGKSPSSQNSISESENNGIDDKTYEVPITIEVPPIYYHGIDKASDKKESLSSVDTSKCPQQVAVDVAVVETKYEDSMVSSISESTTNDNTPTLSLIKPKIEEKKQSDFSQIQNQKQFTGTFVKQGSLRRQFSDGLEGKHLTDVSVNKLISRFEKRKSSSSPDSLKENRFTVHAVIESKGYECHDSSPPEIVRSKKFSTSTSASYSDSDEDENHNVRTTMIHKPATIVTAYSVASLTNLHQDQQTLSIEHNTNNDNNINININDNNNISINKKNNDNNNYKIINSRRKSIEWAKSSKSINKTIDLLDKDAEVYYSFEDDEDSKRSNSSINNSTKGGTACGDITTGTNDRVPVRHAYNVIL